MEGSTPSEMEKEIAHTARAGNIGTPAAPGVMPHRGEGENEENLWMMVRTWTNWNPIREPLAASSLKWERLESSHRRKNRATRR
jgi:hypothetical protein